MVKPTTATKLADADEETGTFTRGELGVSGCCQLLYAELLLEHVMNILNERAASTEDPMMAVDLLDLWYQHQDRLPNREICEFTAVVFEIYIFLISAKCGNVGAESRGDLGTIYESYPMHRRYWYGKIRG